MNTNAAQSYLLNFSPFILLAMMTLNMIVTEAVVDRRTILIKGRIATPMTLLDTTMTIPNIQ